MMDGKTHAPYNFVPFPEHAIYPYGSERDLPSSNEVDPELLTGEIHVTVEAETPICVGDRETGFVLDEGGSPYVPGSSLRGLIRTHVQILGLAPVRMTEDVEPCQEKNSRRIPNGFERGIPSYSGQGIDYARALFGWIGKDEKETSMRSRLSFGDLKADGPVQLGDWRHPVLMGPRPTFCKGYVEDGKTYRDQTFRLRGYKQYWMKQAALGQTTENRNIESKLRFAPAGSRFSGIIRYHNLKADELGLLLWALQLEEDSRISLGAAKPYGYGRCKLQITALKEAGSLYGPGCLCRGLEPSDADAAAAYRAAYEKRACRLWNEQAGGERLTSIRDLPSIQDFFFLRKEIVSEDWASYMNLKEYRKVQLPMPTVAERRRQKAQAQPRTYDSYAEAMAALLKATGGVQSAAKPIKKKKKK